MLTKCPECNEPEGHLYDCLNPPGQQYCMSCGHPVLSHASPTGCTCGCRYLS